MICGYCKLPLSEADHAMAHSYWGGIPFACHKACREPGRLAEAFECQLIDSDCNDCKHFKRGHLIPLPAHMQKTIDEGKVPGFKSGVFTGHCLKFDRETRAYPNKWTGRECFEHRRA